MEILQTIWTALSTPNEKLIELFSILLVSLEITVSMLLFTTILNIKATTNQKVTFVLVLSLLSCISNAPLLYSISKFINLILFIVAIVIIFKTTLLKSIIGELLTLIIAAIFEPIIIQIFTTYFHIDYNSLLTIPIYRISYVLILYSIIYLLYRLAKYFKFNISLFDNIDTKNKVVLTVSSVCGIIAIISQIYLFKFYSENMPNIITIISLITLIIYFFINMYSISKTMQLYVTSQNLEESQLYNKSLKILHDNIRAFKHDFNNIVQSIGGYIATNDLDGLKIYYSQLLADCQQVNNLSTLSPEVINNPAIYSLLASKYYKADNLGIKIKLDIFINLNELNIKIYEFTRILGILLDNAIEATKDCDNKLITVEFRNDAIKNRQLLIVKNTYLEKDIDLDKIFEKGYSSKPNNSGLGLWEIKEILKKNNNLNLYTSKTDDLFSQQLEIYL